jgi:glycosyltransferase involved in cell wall biosynthesis
MAYGRPVVATRVGGLAESNAETLVDSGDVPALRRAVESLLADGQLRHRLGGEGRESLERTHANDPLGARLAAYESALRA